MKKIARNSTPERKSPSRESSNRKSAGWAGSQQDSIVHLPNWRQQTSPVSGPSPAMTELANLVHLQVEKAQINF